MMPWQQHLQQRQLPTHSSCITIATIAAADSVNMSSCSCSTCQLAAALQESRTAAAAVHTQGI
jgi:hypothetical protein